MRSTIYLFETLSIETTTTRKKGWSWEDEVAGDLELDMGGYYIYFS